MKPASFCIILGLIVNIRATVGILTEEPKNTVALLDESTIIKCKSDIYQHLAWHMYGNKSEEVELWNGYDLNTKACPCPCYKIDNGVPGKYNLNIKARRETAMRYMCTEPETLRRVSAQLIVIASNFTCNYTMNVTDVTLSCVIGVYGEWAPQIKWNNSDGAQMNGTSRLGENGQIISTLTMPLTSHETFFTAHVYFSDSGRPAEVTAQNVPAYAKEWKSTPFRIEPEVFPAWIAVAVIVSCAFLILIVLGLFIKKRKSRYCSRKAKNGRSTEENVDFIKVKA